MFYLFIFLVVFLSFICGALVHHLLHDKEQKKIVVSQDMSGPYRTHYPNYPTMQDLNRK